MNYASYINDILQILNKSEDIKNRYKASIDRINNLKTASEDAKYCLGVIGITSSGKSTLINAFLGEDLLPRAARPSSSQLVRCQNGDKRQAIISFEDNSEKIIESSQLNKSIIKSYADESENTDNTKHVKQIDITIPSFPLDRRIVLVDSPGLGAYGQQNHEKLTMESFLPTIDFCVFVTTCTSNSDLQIKDILNRITEHEKPIIIVQNMIDSIKPSPDGKKSRQQVAKEHKARVERIIEQSDIKNKKIVKVVQVSAKNALDRITNKENNNDDSNFDELINNLKDIFNQMLPAMEENRTKRLIKEIDTIINEARKDSTGIKPEDMTFEFENVSNYIDDNLKKIETSINDEFLRINAYKNGIQNQYSFSKEDIELAQNLMDRLENFLCSHLRTFNSFIEEISEKLNIDSRDLFTLENLPKRNKLNLATHTSYERTKESGAKGFFKRGARKVVNFFGADVDWGYETKKTVTVDNEKARRDICNFIDSSSATLKNIISNKIFTFKDKIQPLLNEEINNRKEAFELRKTKALTSIAYNKIADELNDLTEPLRKTVKETTISFNPTNIDANFGELKNTEVPRLSLDIYKLSERIKCLIHKTTVKNIINENSRTYIFGWDKDSESIFIKQSLDLIINSDRIKDGEQTFPTFTLIDTPSPSYFDQNKNKDFFCEKNIESGRNIFILINATQIGNSKISLASCQINKALNKNDKVFFVVQNFTESIKGDNIQEIMGEMKELKDELNFTINPTILVNHDNPIYNLMLIELQNKLKDSDNIIHESLIETLDYFNENFHYLMNTEIANNFKKIKAGLSGRSI